METNWKGISIEHNGSKLVQVHVCSACSGVRCEVRLPLGEEPEGCLKEGLGGA